MSGIHPRPDKAYVRDSGAEYGGVELVVQVQQEVYVQPLDAGTVAHWQAFLLPFLDREYKKAFKTAAVTVKGNKS